ncbi:DsbA family protein [Paracoccus sp. p4-l81]|uniref:DsbA family protein n=1 Tax=Paracoccus sp. p4-l81 TaxID=3342806 RepID=UPI0035B9A583
MLSRRHLLAGLGAGLALPAALRARPARAQDDLRAAVERDPNAPLLGNANGDVTVVEFFDYNCHFCRRNTAALAEVIGSDPGLRVVMREWPIFGPGSEAAATVALAASQQRKYWPLHQALMASRGRVDEGVALRAAQGLGLDMDRLARDRKAPAVAAHLAQSEVLANALRLMGTPTFVIGREVHFGAASTADLREMIATARG